MSVGPPKKPMEVPRTREYKTLGKSLCKMGVQVQESAIGIRILKNRVRVRIRVSEG